MALAILAYSGVDASSFRSWFYLMTVALVPPIAMRRLTSHAHATLTISKVIHGGRPALRPRLG
jgi:hypothetical protein